VWEGNIRRLAGTLCALATGSLDDFVLGGFNIGRVEEFVETFDCPNLFEGGINPFFVLPAQESYMQTSIVDWLRACPLSEFPYYLIPFIFIGKSQWFLELVRRKI
jgi:hypothetical protein